MTLDPGGPQSRPGKGRRVKLCGSHVVTLEHALWRSGHAERRPGPQPLQCPLEAMWAALGGRKRG